jgi:hypothetical protein
MVGAEDKSDEVVHKLAETGLRPEPIAAGSFALIECDSDSGQVFPTQRSWQDGG